jgi:protein-tyrosine-phosphatase
MAQAFFERHAPDDVRAESAGSAPAAEVWPAVIEAMNEVGIDLRGRRPRKLMVEMQLHADWAVTMGCGDVCPTSRPRSRTGICAIRRARASRRSARYAMRSRSARYAPRAPLAAAGCRDEHLGEVDDADQPWGLLRLPAGEERARPGVVGIRAVERGDQHVGVELVLGPRHEADSIVYVVD